MSVGAGAAPAVGESWGAARSSPAGDITQTGCSPNVFINGRNAALTTQSIAKCENHPAPVQIADGSASVFINGYPAARKGDKLTCDSKIATGSNNVFIGGGTKRYLKVNEEISESLRVGIDIAIIIASMGRGGLPMLAKGLGGGLKAVAPCALKFAATVGVSYLFGRFVAGPAISGVIGGFSGNPVDLTSGRKLLLEEGETDFALPGLMPIEWSRFYASDLNVDSVLGKGWVLPWEQNLRRNGSFVYLIDNQGRSVPFVNVEPGESIYNPSRCIWSARKAAITCSKPRTTSSSTSAKCRITTNPFRCSVLKTRSATTCISAVPMKVLSPTSAHPATYMCICSMSTRWDG
ncbi:PAAR domain-containing protein [Pseudomonas amygdali pv. morsprunorum]|nr:PAAR domain-containing protein [Pseudomonas amygdali pv. morsprunorum]